MELGGGGDPRHWGTPPPFGPPGGQDFTQEGLGCLRGAFWGVLGGQGFTREGLGGLRGVFSGCSGVERASRRSTSTPQKDDADDDDDDDDDDDLGASLERPGRDMGV